MNIEDFEPIKGLTFKDVFEKQKELIFAFEPAYKAIYEEFDIDYINDQEEFKMICWRITEELCEALEAIDNNEETHIIEELLDGFNFLIELITLYGFKVENLDFSFKRESNVNSYYDILDIIKILGLTANCLKNRKWRQSQYLVDLKVFEARFKLVFNKYLNLLRKYLSDDEIIEKWSLKYQVNLFRLNTNY